MADCSHTGTGQRREALPKAGYFCKWVCIALPSDPASVPGMCTLALEGCDLEVAGTDCSVVGVLCFANFLQQASIFWKMRSQPLFPVFGLCYLLVDQVDGPWGAGPDPFTHITCLNQHSQTPAPVGQDEHRFTPSRYPRRPFPWGQHHSHGSSCLFFFLCAVKFISNGNFHSKCIFLM